MNTSLSDSHCRDVASENITLTNWQSRMARSLAFSIAAISLACVSPVFAQQSGASANIEEIEASLALARMRTQRWERVIETQRRLATNPGAHSDAVKSAADDLSASGRELVFEGASGGLSTFFKLQAFYARDYPETEASFRKAAALVNGVWKGYVKNQVKAPSKGPWKPEDEIDRVNVVLQIPLEFIHDKNTRALLQASLLLGQSGTKWLGAYIRGDEQRTGELLQEIQGILQGTRGMLSAYELLKTKDDWVSAARIMARRYPRFAQFGQLMTTTGLAEFNIALSLANLGWGSYAWLNGHDLEHQAREIRYDQARAVVVLTRLLPKAKVELAQARVEERQLDAALRATKAEGFDRSTTPTVRFMDDGAGVPPPPMDLPTMQNVIERVPPLRFDLTEEERQRREDEAERRREAARAAARAAAAEQRQYARERGERYERESLTERPSPRSSDTESARSGPDRSSSRSRTDDVKERINGIIRELNTQDPRSGLGKIRGF